MSSSDLIRWGGLAAMVGGVSWLVYGLVSLAGASVQESTPLDLFIVVGWLLQVVGMIGLHTLQKEGYGRIGRAGFYTFIVGAPVQALGLLLVLAGSGTLGTLLTTLGGLGILVGLVLYGAATLQARVLPRWCGIALIVALPATILLQEYGGIVFGAVWVALGYMLWSQSEAPSERPSRVS